MTSFSEPPGGIRAASVYRARSPLASMSSVLLSGISMTWSMPAAIRSWLRLVWCTSTARRPRPTASSDCSGLGQRGRGARVVVLGRHDLVGQQVRLQGDVEVAEVVGELHLVLDGGDRAAGQRDQPGAGDPHGPAARRAPLGGPAQDAGPQVERARVVDDLAVVEVERRVLHQQPDQLAVGDVDHRLALLGEPVAGLGVGQRPLLEEAVEVGAGDDDRLALLERAAHADVPVGQREHRLVHRERGVVQADLGQRPRLDRESGPSLGHAFSPMSCSRSVTTTSAPAAASASACPTRSTPTTYPKPPARPACHAGDRVLEDHGRGRLDAEQPGAGQEGVRLGLAAQPVARGDHAVDPRVDQVGEAAGLDDLLAVGRRRDDGGAQAGVLHRAQVAHRAGVDLDTVLVELAQHHLVLAGRDRLHGRGVRRVVRACPRAA